MSNNIVPIGQAKAPASMRDRLKAGAAVNRNFSDGVRDSFPILSIKGKVFRIRVNGQETPLIDPQTRQVIPYLDVILVNASPHLSKTYYIKGFEEGEFNQPDCWSLDSIRPDPSVPNKVNPTCGDCPMNIFGSAPSRDPASGKRGGKACQDARRVAVMMPGHLETEEPLVFMMRVPATSLKNLKAYAQLLERQGWEPAGCVTRLSFDYQEAYPKLLFNFVDGLNDSEYDKVVAIAESPQTSTMLSAPDFDMAASQPPVQVEKTEQRVRQATPVMAEPEVVQEASLSQPIQASPMPAHTEVKAAAAVQEVKSELVELPDGTLFDPSTGEYVERPAPKVDMPANDPDVLTLPEGRFFNRKTRLFVTGPEIGAKPVVEEEAPKRRGRKPKAEEAPEKKAEPEAKVEEQPAEKLAGNGATDAGEKVKTAPAALDDLIRTVFPSKN